MTPAEVELIRDLISEAVPGATEHPLDGGPEVVEAFLDSVGVEGALLLAREVLQRRAYAEEVEG